MSSLGRTGTSTAPVAARVTRAGWRDPRLWIGLLLVAGSVVLGSRLLAAADDTLLVWAVVDDLGAGSPVADDDVVAVRVRFAQDEQLDRYLTADRPLPEGIVLERKVAGGELLPASAVVAATDATSVLVPVEVEPHRVPGDVDAGAVVDVYVGGAAARGKRAGPVLAEVTVVAAPPVAESFAVTGSRQLVLAVDDAEVPAFLDLLDREDDPVVRIVQRS